MKAVYWNCMELYVIIKNEHVEYWDKPSIYIGNS